MSISIIGAGFGRTGTLSLKYALEKLGYDKCYHMVELFNNPPHLKYWQQLENGGEPDWDDLFNGFKATVDFPGCIYYKQMMKRYPDAKVILTVRPPEKWWKSVHDTIYKDMPLAVKGIMLALGIFNPKPAHIVRTLNFAKGSVWKRIFQGRFMDKEYAMSVFTDFNNEVIRFVPKEKLLVFEVKDGWEPLCKFLNVPIPDEPFPRVNDTEEFNNRRKIFIKKRNTKAVEEVLARH